MRLVLFGVLLTLCFYSRTAVFGQSADNQLVVDHSVTEFSIERSFTISLLVRDAGARPVVNFPDIPGLVKQGVSASTTRTDQAGREVVSHQLVQTYLATRPGTIAVAPFVLSANGQVVRVAGLVLTVRPGAAATQAAARLATANADKQAAFLQATVGQPAVYPGEALRVTLAFFVAENYPYELTFSGLESQIAAIVRRIRPVNAWEETDNITEITPRPARINGRRYVEYRLYQATFFLLNSRVAPARPLGLPAVSLTVMRRAGGPPTSPPEALTATSPTPTTAAQAVTFSSEPVPFSIRPLPAQTGTQPAQRGQTSVGTFRLTDGLDRGRVLVGQSVRYDIRLEGQGNIAGIQPPQLSLPAATDLDVFPPQVQEQISRAEAGVSGTKSFRYFLIPRQKGTVLLANRFFWVYFDPRTGRYDTLRPQATLRVVADGDSTNTGIIPADTLGGTGQPSIYAGLDNTSSTAQSVNWPLLIRAVANVLIVVMLLGTVFIFFKR